MSRDTHFSRCWLIGFGFCCGFISAILTSLSLHASAPPRLSTSLEQTAAQSAAVSDAFQDGLAALKDNRPADALAYLTTAEQRHPDDPRVHNFRGIALAQLGRAGEAAGEYETAIRLDPKMADAYRNLGFLDW